jgi:hypothetical protein
MSTLAARQSPILPFTGVDLSAALGKLVTFAAGVPAVNASATVPAVGIVLEGNDATHQSSIGLLGGNLPPVRMLIDGASAQLYPGDTVQQAAGGGVTKDVGTGTGRVVVGVLSDPNGAVAGDLAEVTPITPQIRT